MNALHASARWIAEDALTDFSHIASLRDPQAFDVIRLSGVLLAAMMLSPTDDDLVTLCAAAHDAARAAYDAEGVATYRMGLADVARRAA